MAQEPSSKDLLDAVKQQESGGRRYKADGKTLLEGPQTKYGTAKGEMQVLDMTNKDPGYGVKPAKDDSPDERARVGKDYLDAMVKRYGDKKTALVAYNWGPGNTDKWLDKGGDFAKLPAETRNYVTKITGSLGSTKLAQATPKAVPVKAQVQKTAFNPAQNPMFAQLGPSYQAAFAVSMLADEGEKEGKDEDAPSESERMLAATASTPAVVADLDLAYQSPFPEAQAQAAPVTRKQVSFLRPVRMAAGGLPFAPTASVRPSARAELDAIKAEYDVYSPKAAEYNTALEKYNTDVYKPYQTQVDAYNAGLEKYKTENFAPYQAKIDAYNAALGKYKTDVYAPYETQVDSYNTALGKYKTDVYDPYEAAQKKYDAEYAAVFATPKPVSYAMSREFQNLVARKPVAPAEFSMAAPTAPAEFSMAAPTAPAQYGGVVPTKPAEFAQKAPTGAPAVSQEAYAAKMAAAKADAGRRQIALSVAMNPEAYGLSMNKFFAEGGEVDAPYGGPVYRAKGSPETGEYFQDPFGVPDSGPVTSDTLSKGKEFKAAEALQALKEVGTGAARNLKNILQGVTETPYNVVGGAADIGNLALMPFGLDSKEPTGGSAQLKRLATEAGIRPAPPTDPRDAGFYMMGELGSSVVNPTGVVRGGVKAAEKAVTKGSKAAEMLAKDFQKYNQTLGPPGASYAVRNKGTPFKMEPSKSRAGELVDQPLNYAEGAIRDARLGLTKLSETLKPEELDVLRAGDPDLQKWFMNRVPSYLRRDFASPEDPFVKAAEEGKLLHFENKPSKYDKGKKLPESTRDRVTYSREQEGFLPEGEAKKDYGKQVETLIDASAYRAEVQDLYPSQIPSSLRNADPSSRVSELASSIDENLELPNLYTEMARMRSMGPTYSAYGQPAIKIPEDYFLKSKTLEGITLPQASQRVAQFKNWRNDNRQRMASKAILDDPDLQYNQNKLPKGNVAVFIPDLNKNPQFLELVKDVGCDGGWCTKEEVNALDFGAGDNELHLIMTPKGRPMAQLTLTVSGGKPGTAEGNSEMVNRFLNKVDDSSPEESENFYAKYGTQKLLNSNKYVMDTPEFKEYIQKYPSRFSISEVKSVGNTSDLSDNKALSDIQQYIQQLDAEFNLKGVSGLQTDKKFNTGLTELDSQLLMSGGNALAARLMYRDADLPGVFADFSTVRAMAIEKLKAEVFRQNNGSKYFTGGENNIRKIIQNAMDDLSNNSPPGRATGGMVERQTSTAKYI